MESVDAKDAIDIALANENKDENVLSLSDIGEPEKSSDREGEDSDSDSSSDGDSDSSSDGESSDNNSDSDGNSPAAVQESDDDEIPRTRNEVLEEEIVPPPPDLVLSKTTPVSLIGTIKTVGEKSVVIVSHKSARYKVLVEGAVLVLGGNGEDKRLVGVLQETFGPVDQPYYVVKFKSEEELEPFKELGGESVYQVMSTGKYVLTEEFKSKGTDASNFNDEEVPLEEQEFSDDEAEMQAKSKSKKRKRNKPHTSSQTLPMPLQRPVSHPQLPQMAQLPFPPMPFVPMMPGIPNQSQFVDWQKAQLKQMEEEKLMMDKRIKEKQLKLKLLEQMGQRKH